MSSECWWILIVAGVSSSQARFPLMRVTRKFMLATFFAWLSVYMLYRCTEEDHTGVLAFAASFRFGTSSPPFGTTSETSFPACHLFNVSKISLYSSSEVDSLQDAPYETARRAAVGVGGSSRR